MLQKADEQRYGTRVVADVRTHNLSVVLKVLRDKGRLSRTELVQATGMVKVTVLSLVHELIQAGLVRESEAETTARAGRPPRFLELAPDGVLGIGVEINVDHISILVAGLNGKEVLAETRRCQNSRVPANETIENALHMIRKVLKQLQARGDRIGGLVVTLPGVLAAPSGIVYNAPYLGWKDVPLADLIRNGLDNPDFTIRVDRLATLAAAAEYRYGEAAGTPDIAVLYGNLGIGGGAMINGELMRGAGGFGSDYGHLQIDPNGPVCACGRRGCLQAHAGLGSVLQNVSPIEGYTDTEIDLDKAVAALIERIENGDAEARRVVCEQQAVWLARGAAILVQVLAPKVLVLGGYFSILAPVMLEAFRQELDQRLVQPNFGGSRIVVSNMGLRSPLVGAVTTVTDQIIANPDRFISTPV